MPLLDRIKYQSESVISLFFATALFWLMLRLIAVTHTESGMAENIIYMSARVTLLAILALWLIGIISGDIRYDIVGSVSAMMYIILLAAISCTILSFALIGASKEFTALIIGIEVVGFFISATTECRRLLVIN